MKKVKVIGLDTETYLDDDRTHKPLSVQIYSEDVIFNDILIHNENVRHIGDYGLIIYVYEGNLTPLEALIRYRLRGAYIFTFNLAFDISVLAKVVHKLGLGIKVLEADGRTIMGEIDFQQHKVRFYDLRNIFMVRRVEEA